MKRLLGLFFLLGCIGQKSSLQSMQGNDAGEKQIAFPGAEGFGKYTTGGRGGKVMIVSNLEDDGAGSFREAAEAKFPRIIVFSVDGTIHLKTPVKIRKNVTIAGQSAPGDGICLADQSVLLADDNIIIRYLRFRMGDRFQRQMGMVNGSGSDDAFGGSRKKNIIIDHCSMSWSNDEVCSIYAGDSTTLQWNLISEPLNYSYHFETGDKDFEKHGYGGIWGGAHFSAHHNLIAHCVSRTPRFNGTRLGADVEYADMWNNVIYNWGSNNVYGGEGGTYQIIANYYKAGPGTSKKVMNRLVNPTRNETVGFGKFYVSENIIEGAPKISQFNFEGVQIGNGKEPFSPDSIIMTKPVRAVDFNYEKAEKAFDRVLKYSGASFRRDTLDQRIVKDVENGTGGFIDVQGGFEHGTAFEKTVKAWPYLKSGKPAEDSDGDGMPDSWEKKHHLNPSDSSDAVLNSIDKQYSNIEVYLNELVKNQSK